MAVRESVQAALMRWRQLETLQAHYRGFVDFLRDAMDHIGFGTTALQEDIASFLEHGPHYIMVQAQRSQAKTTITACFAVWTLIHNPRARVLVVSAGGTQANEISTLITKLILTMDELECMRPDRNNGDRTSVEAFDVHYTLKGVDKSPSVACIGITGNLAGKRADLLVADDIESKKNSQTQGQRQLLLDRSKEFSDLCSSGRIIYLGTPQSMDSVYNSLPSRGFTVRIWPGRFPTAEQFKNYSDMLAPYIKRRLDANPDLATGGGALGDQGQPTDPQLQPEEQLQGKERDKGPSDFQLQYMLNTRLLDGMRYPLHPEQLVVMQLTGRKEFPIEVTPGFGRDMMQCSVMDYAFQMQRPHSLSDATSPLTGPIMYVDPAGGGANGDETGYAVTGCLNGNIFLLDVGGVPGGYSVKFLEDLAEVAKKWGCTSVMVEKNFGYGAFVEVWLPILRRICPNIGIEEDFVHGQKELRIIETLEPVIFRNSLIVNEDIVRSDVASIQNYPFVHQKNYSFFFQLAKITRDKGALIHDDRLDAVEGAVRYWVKTLAIDQESETRRLEAEKLAKFMADPLGHNRYNTPQQQRTTSFHRRKR